MDPTSEATHPAAGDLVPAEARCRARPPWVARAVLDGAEGPESVVFAVALLDSGPTVHAHLTNGEEVLSGARLLGGLGRAPWWLAVVDHAQRVLNVCPSAPVQALLDYVTCEPDRRLGMAQDAGEATEHWLGWAFGYDPDERVARAWVERFPLPPTVLDTRCGGATEAVDPVDAALRLEQFSALRRDPRLAHSTLARVCGDLAEVAQVVEEGPDTDLAWLIRNVALPEDLAARLAARVVADEFMALQMARVRRLPPRVVSILSTSPSGRVHQALARSSRGLPGSPGEPSRVSRADQERNFAQRARC